MVEFVLVSTTKIPSYISESGTITVPRINGSLVSRFQNYIYLRTDEDHIVGGFEPGTPITADVVYGGQVDINVTWRDAQGCAMSGSWSKASGWDLPRSEAQRGDCGGMGGVEQVSRRMFF